MWSFERLSSCPLKKALNSEALSLKKIGKILFLCGIQGNSVPSTELAVKYRCILSIYFKPVKYYKIRFFIYFNSRKYY